jgi:hypothetical protein
LVHLVVSFVVSDKQLFAPLIGITFCQRYPAQPLRDSLFTSLGQSWTVYRLILCLYGTAFALLPMIGFWQLVTKFRRCFFGKGLGDFSGVAQGL